MNKEFPNEATLIAEMKATFPGLMARPVREFGLQGFNHGAWTGGPGNMPDGLPIFDPLQHGVDDGYDGGVHEGFTAWLERRGWYLENYDGSAYLAIPILQAQQLGAAWAAYEANTPKRPSLADNESPF